MTRARHPPGGGVGLEFLPGNADAGLRIGYLIG
jgi:hypothetical protein